MADLGDSQAAQAVKIIGSDSAGVESTPVASTSNGAIHTNLRNNAGTEIGTALNPIYMYEVPLCQIPDDTAIYSKKRVLAPGTIYYVTETLANNISFTRFHIGGTVKCEGGFSLYTAASSTFVDGGDFESSGDVSNWANTGIGDGALLTPAYSTAQANTGTGSLLLANGTKSDANNYAQVTRTFTTAQDFSGWRAISAAFYNSPPAGGAVTRTISIRLTDANGVVNVHSVSGLTNASPFNAAGWISISSDLENPTSTTGTFDHTQVVSISLRMQDSANKAFTAIYWDSVKLSGAVVSGRTIYSPGQTTAVYFEPALYYTSGTTISIYVKNNDTVSGEFQYFLAGAIKP